VSMSSLPIQEHYVRFEVFTAVSMKNAVFWDVAPCRSCVNRRFGGTYRLHLQLTYLLNPFLLYPAVSRLFLFLSFTGGRTAWTSDQLVARPLPKHRTTQTQNKHIHTPNIHALDGIGTHDPGFRASEDSTCLRPLGYRDRF
jgi:hypothetical protein